MSNLGTVWEDKMPARATRPMSALTERNLLFSAVRPGDRVHFATLLCMGVSGDDVAQVVGKLGEAGAMAIVHDQMREIGLGADVEALAAEVDRARNTLAVARSRAKKRKSK